MTVEEVEIPFPEIYREYFAISSFSLLSLMLLLAKRCVLERCISLGNHAHLKYLKINFKRGGERAVYYRKEDEPA